MRISRIAYLMLLIFVVFDSVPFSFAGRHNEQKKRDAFVNYMQDVDPESAPDFAEHLNLSSVVFLGSGGAINLYDNAPPVSDANFDPANYYTTNNTIDFTTKEYYFYAGGYVEYVNETDSFQIEVTPTGFACFRVANSNFSRNILSIAYLRRAYSVRDTTYAKNVNLKKQIDKLYGKANKICDEEPKADISDIYIGVYDDASMPGPVSGCQKEYLNAVYHVNRYARNCYNKTLITRLTYMQFYPFLNLAGFSDRNLFQSTIIFTNFTHVQDRSYRNFVNQQCQNAPDYCTYYLNNGCVYPQLPNIACNNS